MFLDLSALPVTQLLTGVEFQRASNWPDYHCLSLGSLTGFPSQAELEVPGQPVGQVPTLLMHSGS